MSSKKGATHTKKHVKRNGRVIHQELVMIDRTKPKKETDDDFEFYGKITRLLGGKMFEVEDEIKNLIKVIAPGSFMDQSKRNRLKEYIHIGNIVKVQKAFDKWYINHCYTQDDVKKLLSYGELRGSLVDNDYIFDSSNLNNEIIQLNFDNKEEKEEEQEINIDDI
jgi:hypothetical protein